MKKVAIIGTAGVPGRYGGFETLAHQLVLQLNQQFQLAVYCSSKFYSKAERQKYWNGARLHYLPLNANGAQSILYDFLSIIHALFYADTLLVLGVSGGLLIPFVKLFTNKKIIINIDGQEWRRAKWNKYVKAFLKFSEIVAVRYADADITDNAALKRYTAINYKTLSHLIEYGADHTQTEKLTEADYLKYPFLRNPYAFKVCRIEPENNVHMILQAFATLPQKTFVMVGNWQNSHYGQQLKKQFRDYPNIHLLDPIYHQKSLDKLRSNCFLYIHGHSAGGTNPSLVEAMYLGRPIITFDVSYNQVTTEYKAFYFKTAHDLIHQLKHLKIPDYKANAERMKAIANKRYTWKMIAAKYAQLIYAFDYDYQKSAVHAASSKIEYEELLTMGRAQLKSPQLFYQDNE
ncbi:MAG: DUF1972 domain-containing protein [Flammeovirgaceae bacterium]